MSKGVSESSFSLIGQGPVQTDTVVLPNAAAERLFQSRPRRHAWTWIWWGDTSTENAHARWVGEWALIRRGVLDRGGNGHWGGASHPISMPGQGSAKIQR